VKNLFGEEDNSPIYVPDTNALLFNPDLENWRFPDVPTFKVVLTPTVTSELDHLKINHKVETVRDKAEGLIRRIKGYRSRGRLTEGVPLVSGTSEIIALAVEPDFAQSLPWLDSGNNDDRMIATFVEVMRLNPRSPVILVTRDLNLQNKAEFARLPFCEPPEP
jgi:predicted ribonuclease YlaK